jgi:hypothetical protein
LRILAIRLLHPELFGAPAEQAIGYHVLAAPAHGESARVSSLSDVLEAQR